MIVGHRKFAFDYLFLRIANSSDIRYIGELVSTAEQYATATKEDGPRMFEVAPRGRQEVC